MPGKKKITHHIKSEKQRRFFGAVASGANTDSGMSKEDALAHLKDSKGKKLPEKAKRKKALGRKS